MIFIYYKAIIRYKFVTESNISFLKKSIPRTFILNFFFVMFCNAIKRQEIVYRRELANKEGVAQVSKFDTEIHFA